MTAGAGVPASAGCACKTGSGPNGTNKNGNHGSHGKHDDHDDHGDRGNTSRTTTTGNTTTSSAAATGSASSTVGNSRIASTANPVSTDLFGWIGLRGTELHDEDRARQAVTSGEVVSLTKVLAKVREVSPGNVLDVHLRQDNGGGWVYALLVLDRGGAYHDVLVDAKHNDVINVRKR